MPMLVDSIVGACPVELGLSIKALPPAGEDPAAREDQLSRADCRGKLLIFGAAPPDDEHANSERLG